MPILSDIAPVLYLILYCLVALYRKISGYPWAKQSHDCLHGKSLENSAVQVFQVLLDLESREAGPVQAEVKDCYINQMRGLFSCIRVGSTSQASL